MKENVVGLENELYDESIDTNSSGSGDWINDAWKGMKKYATNKVSSWFSGFYRDESEEYKAFKNQVEAALEGENFGREIYEVPLKELEREGAWGMNYGNKIWVPKLRDILKIVGVAYDCVTGKEIGTQTYIKLHELFENVYGVNSENAEEHAEYEAMLGRALSELAAEGNEKANEAYRGMVATYIPRFKGIKDKLAEKVKKYFPKIEADVFDLVRKPAYAVC